MYQLILIFVIVCLACENLKGLVRSIIQDVDAVRNITVSCSVIDWDNYSHDCLFMNWERILYKLKYVDYYVDDTFMAHDISAPHLIGTDINGADIICACIKKVSLTRG